MRFNHQDAAVELAKSVADVQEKKTRARVEVRKSKVSVQRATGAGNSGHTTPDSHGE